MKKYINGKFYDEAEVDTSTLKLHFCNSRSRASSYEAKIKELEEIVEKLLAQQNTETQEGSTTETVTTEEV